MPMAMAIALSVRINSESRRSMKALLLYNIKAGKGKIAKRVDRLVEIFAESGIALRPKLIEFGCNPFDGDEDVELAVVCGGDGTINYVVNMMRDKGLDPMLGIIPAGTANDFAGAIGMPKDVYKAARKIATGSERRVDCGYVNGRHFINVLSFGVLTTTSQQTTDKEKRMVGKLAYIRVGLKDLFTMHRIHLHVKSDNEEFDTDALMFLAFIGETAGRFRLARKAKIDDGLLDVLILEHRNIFATCWNMLRYLFGGKPKAVRYIQTTTLEVAATSKERTDVDGQAGPDFPMDVKCSMGSIKVRC